MDGLDGVDGTDDSKRLFKGPRWRLLAMSDEMQIMLAE